MNSNKFRKELKKIMPGYKWTVHRNRFAASKHLSATGIQTAGFNRLSTLRVIKREKEHGFKYEVTSSGFGKNCPWLSDYTDVTLARALRGLQNHYESMAQTYSSHASCLQRARKKTK